MKATHEHEWEAAPGLPSALPAGERVVWQGAPNWRSLAIHAFHVPKVAMYFSLIGAAAGAVMMASCLAVVTLSTLNARENRRVIGKSPFCENWLATDGTRIKH